MTLLFWGWGEDGHTASLLPDSKSIGETVRLAVPVYPLRYLSHGVYMEKPKNHRITLTLPVLNNAAQILSLVAGQSKANIIGEILGDGRKKERYPAGLIKPVRGNLLWLIDKEAAGKI